MKLGIIELFLSKRLMGAILMTLNFSPLLTLLITQGFFTKQNRFWYAAIFTVPVAQDSYSSYSTTQLLLATKTVVEKLEKGQ